MQKLGINLDAVDGFSYRDYIKAAKELGFTAVFSDMTTCDCPQEIAALCKEYGLEYSFIHAPYMGTYSLWQEGEKGDKMYESILSCISICEKADVPIAVVHISSGFNPPPMTELGKTRFKNIVGYAKDRNVKIAFENLRNFPYLEWAMNTFKEYSNVGFCWDVGHENCFTEDIEYLKIYGDKLLCTHIHDNNCEKGGDLHLIPFDGKIDYKSSIKNLKATSFTGPLMLEVFAKNEMYNGISPLDFLTRAYKSIEKVRDLLNEGD
ncbi:MAG: sugar phosphate isomerase/epimerase [Clostridia bacterium]|nr:sugar phosphate isomerase/epimerase [Clostridia bacterium]